MRGYRLVHIGSILAIAACMLLAACGVSSVAGTATGGTGTPTSCKATPVAATGGSRDEMDTVVHLAAGHSDLDPVALTLDRSRYEGCDVIMVTIANDLGSSIVVTDHHTDCSVVILQKLLNGIWSDQARCPLTILTRNIQIQPHSTLKQTLRPSQGSKVPLAWPSGTYRLDLPYAPVSGAGPQPSHAFSPTFAIV